MTDPRQIAAGIVGVIEWTSEVSGLCHCPGEARHTHKTGKKDCRVNIDGAPTIYCFHNSCEAAVAAANRKLRCAIGQSPWEIVLPGGKILRSGDILQSDGSVKTRALLAEGHHGGAAAPPYLKSGLDGVAPHLQRDAGPHHEGEKLLLETLRANAERFKTELFEFFRWPFAQIVADSPLLVADREADEQFRTWLRLWPAHCHVWIGDVYSSGRPEHRTHFRPVAEWYQIGPVMGNFTCGAAFKPGSFQRSNANLAGERFMVVESDSLAKDDVGAIFAYLNARLHFNLHAIIDTAGKSLHGWFDAPRDRQMELRLKAVLTVFGCDPKLFTYSQPVRLPGAWRDGKLQRIVWLKE